MAKNFISSLPAADRSYSTDKCFWLRQETYGFSNLKSFYKSGWKIGKIPWDVATAF